MGTKTANMKRPTISTAVKLLKHILQLHSRRTTLRSSRYLVTLPKRRMRKISPGKQGFLGEAFAAR